MLVIWDLWRNKRVVKNAFYRSSHFAHVQIDEKGTGVIFVIGFDKTRTQCVYLPLLALPSLTRFVRDRDPYFTAMHIPLPVTENTNPLQATRVAGFKSERTPRACAVYGNVLAFADRLGHVTFWNWMEQLSATMILGQWQPHKGVSTWFSYGPDYSPIILSIRNS